MIPAKYIPTRKWLAARVAAGAAVATMTVVTGGFDDEETLAGIALVAEALVSYLIPNAEDRA